MCIVLVVQSSNVCVSANDVFLCNNVIILSLCSGTMWPWAQPSTSNPSFQPPSAFPHQHVHHVTPSAPLHAVTPQPPGGTVPSAYVGYQSPHFAASASAASPGASELSHSHPGIGYGIPRMSSLSVPGQWTQEGLSHSTSVISPSGGAPGSSPVALSFRSPHEEMSGSLSHLGSASVSPTTYVTPPTNPTDTPSPTLHQAPPLSGPPTGVARDQVPLVSPNPATYATPTPQQPQAISGTSPHQAHSLTPPQHHSYTSSSPGAGAMPPQPQHIHSSSPFSVDYLLRGNPPPSLVESLGASSGQGRMVDDPTYGGTQTGGYITGNKMGQEIPTGGWSLVR